MATNTNIETVPNAGPMGGGIDNHRLARGHVSAAAAGLLAVAQAKARASSEDPGIDRSAANAEAARRAGWQGPGR